MKIYLNTDHNFDNEDIKYFDKFDGYIFYAGNQTTEEMNTTARDMGKDTVCRVGMYDSHCDNSNGNVAFAKSMKALHRMPFDLAYLDEPFRQFELIKDPVDFTDISMINIFNQTALSFTQKNLVIGDGWRMFERLDEIDKDIPLCWTYYSYWYKFFWWWIKLGTNPTKNIRDVPRLNHIWLTAKKPQQWKYLIRLAKEKNVDAWLYVSREKDWRMVTDIFNSNIKRIKAW